MKTILFVLAIVMLSSCSLEYRTRKAPHPYKGALQSRIKPNGFSKLTNSRK